MHLIRALIALAMTAMLVEGFVPHAVSVARPFKNAAIASSATTTAPVPYAGGSRGEALRMGWGDALGKAFANEEMGASKNPGLKNEPNACMVTVNGKTIKAIQGQRLRDVVASARAKIEYGCEKGDCGTCESIVDGKKIRICKAIVPRNKTTVNIKTKFG